MLNMNKTKSILFAGDNPNIYREFSYLESLEEFAEGVSQENIPSVGKNKQFIRIKLPLDRIFEVIDDKKTKTIIEQEPHLFQDKTIEVSNVKQAMMDKNLSEELKAKNQALEQEIANLKKQLESK